MILWRQAILLTVALKILALVVVFDRGAQDAFDLPKATVSHALSLILGALLLGVALRGGWRLMPRGLIALFVAGVVVSYSVSALVAINPYLAIFGEVERYLGVITVVDWALTYLAFAVAVRSPEDLALPILAVITGGIVSFAYAGLQAIGRDPITWVEGSATRPFAFLGNPDVFGQYLASLFACSVAVVSFPPAPHSRRWRIAGALGIAATLLAIVFVATRSALLGVIGALLIASGLALATRRLRRRELTFAAVATTACIAIVAGALGVTPLGERVLNTITTGAGIRERLLIFDSAIQMFADRPLFGVGPDNFGAAYSTYRQPEAVVLISRFLTESSAHSFPLQALATVGLVGTIAMAGLLAVSAWLGVRTYLRDQDPICAIALIVGGAFLANGLLTVDAVGVMWILWSCVGLIDSRENADSTSDTPGRSFVPLPIATLAVLVSLVVALVSWQPVRASESARNADVFVSRKQASSAIAAAKLAVSIDPGRAIFWNTLGRAHELANDFPSAETAFSEAAERAPYRSEIWGNLARARANQAIHGTVAQKQRALDAARRGIEVDPNDPSAHHLLAEIALALNEPALAVTAEERAIEIFPADYTYHLQLAKAQLRLSRYADAEASARRGMDYENVPALHLVRAQALIPLGRTEEAKTELRYVLERDPANDEARSLLVTISGS